MPRLSIIIDVSRTALANTWSPIYTMLSILVAPGSVNRSQSIALLAHVLSDSMLVSRNAVSSSSLESTMVGGCQRCLCGASPIGRHTLSSLGRVVD